jgi:hypothetical protein
MPFTAATAKAMMDAAATGVTKLEVWTVDYGTKLASFDITFEPATEDIPSVLMVGSLPISTTGLDDGIAGAFRVVTDSATRWEESGSSAVNISEAMVTLAPSLVIATGQTVNLTACSLSFAGTLLVPEA